VLGDAALDANGAPTAASALLLGRADPLVAPPTDYFGCPRSSSPDIGAIEYGACPVVPSPAPAPAAPSATRPATTPSKPVNPIAARRIKARIVSVRTRRRAHRVVLYVRSSNATRIVASLLVRGHLFARVSHRGSARNGVELTLRAPRKGRVRVRVLAVGAGGATARTITVKAARRR
jgi:hypothetical protein